MLLTRDLRHITETKDIFIPIPHRSGFCILKKSEVDDGCGGPKREILISDKKYIKSGTEIVLKC